MQVHKIDTNNQKDAVNKFDPFDSNFNVISTLADNDANALCCYDDTNENNKNKLIRTFVLVNKMKFTILSRAHFKVSATMDFPCDERKKTQYI